MLFKDIRVAIFVTVPACPLNVVYNHLELFYSNTVDPLIICRVSIFRLPNIVIGVVSDYVITLLVAIK